MSNLALKRCSIICGADKNIKIPVKYNIHQNKLRKRRDVLNGLVNFSMFYLVSKTFIPEIAKADELTKVEEEEIPKIEEKISKLDSEEENALTTELGAIEEEVANVDENIARGEETIEQGEKDASGIEYNIQSIKELLGL